MRIPVGDWVTIAEIAGRIARSRETVRLWSVGRAGPAGSRHRSTRASDTQFYSWAEIASWLRPVGVNVPHAELVLAAENLALRMRHLLPQLSQPDAVLKLLHHRPTAQPGRTLPDLPPPTYHL